MPQAWAFLPPEVLRHQHKGGLTKGQVNSQPVGTAKLEVIITNESRPGGEARPVLLSKLHILLNRVKNDTCFHLEMFPSAQSELIRCSRRDTG